jgi:Insect cuticle protein
LFVASCAASHYGAISTQFQAHDGHGGYDYGYTDPLSSKQESKHHDGSVHGGYSYVDAHGHTQSVKYIADPHKGFQVVAATNLPKGPSPAVSHYHEAPKPVEKTYEVLAAEHKHFAAHAEANARGYYHEAPKPVQKTYEVLAAEQKHFAAHAEANARAHHHYKRSIYEHAPAYNYKSYEAAPAPVNGVPVDTAEVQHAKANHFALVSAAKAKIGHSGHYSAPAPAYNHGPSHYSAPAPAYNHYAAPAYNYKSYEPAPAPVNGVPVDTAEVEHAKAIHFAAYSAAKTHHGYNGAPEDTYEVKAEKAKHFALVAQAASKSGYGHGQEDDGSYNAHKYENEYHH